MELSRSASTLRIIRCFSAISSWLPCDMFKRNTSAPASCRARMVSYVSDAGPKVATILTLRVLLMGVILFVVRNCYRKHLLRRLSPNSHFTATPLNIHHQNATD